MLSEHANCVTQTPLGVHSTYHYRVTVYDIRLANLQILVDAFGSARSLADHTGADEGHIKQILKGAELPSGTKKNVGNDLARKLEDGCLLDPGDMDRPMNPTPPQKDSTRLAADEQMVLALYRKASPELRRAIRITAELARKEPAFDEEERSVVSKEQAEASAATLDKWSVKKPSRASSRTKKKTA